MPIPSQISWPLQQSHLSACGVQTRVLQGGADLKATEAVVFVHGNPGSCADWRYLMEQTAPLGRVIAMDMPGFGQADKPDEYPYSVEGGATFLGEALRQLGVLKAHLVLHDFGGPWGLMWAAMNPLSVGSITLINTGVLKNYRWHFMARIWRTPLLGELQMALTNRIGFKAVMRIGNPRGLPDEFLERMYEEMDAGTRRAILRLYRATSDLQEKGELLSRMLKPHDFRALVIWGEADPYISVSHAKQQRETFPGAEIVTLPQSGHFPFADDPMSVAKALIPFMQKQLGSTQTWPRMGT